MNKHARLLLALTIFTLLTFTGAGCSLLVSSMVGKEGTSGESTSEVGALVVDISSSGIKTLLPPIDMTPARYKVSGSGPNGGSFQQDALTTKVTIPDLSFGTWTVTAEALNAAGTIIGRGQGTATVHAGQTSSLQVAVAPLTGFGTLQLTVNWPSAETESPAVTAKLLPPSGTAVDLTFTIPSPGQAVCMRTNIGNGYYTLTLELRDGGALLMGALEVVRIVKDQTTTGVFDFTQINDPDGTIVVNTTPPLEDPITVTLSGQKATLQSGEQMTVTASVPAGTGNVVYAWYLNGVSKATGSSYTVASDLEAGVYRLDVAVFTADGKRAGSASCQFQVSAPAVPPPPVQATLEWDPNTEPDLGGYKLYYGVASGSYPNIVDVGNVTTYTLTGLAAGTTYYIAAKAYNTSGMQSGYSNEVAFTSAP